MSFDALQSFAYRNARQPRAAAERFFAYRRHAVGERQAFKRGAAAVVFFIQPKTVTVVFIVIFQAAERFVRDGCYAVGKINVFKACTAGERASSDYFNIVGKSNAC